MPTDAELNDMMGTIRRAVTFTFASGVTGALVDLGKGRSLVSFEIPVALADGSMTFKKGAGGDEQDDAPTTTFVIQNENGTGADTTAYTVDHSTGTTSHPVNAPGFRGARWLAAISSAGQGTKTLTFITEPT